MFVCIIEFGEMVCFEFEFFKCGVKFIGFFVNIFGSYEGWISDIKDVIGFQVNFFIIVDKECKVVYFYDM